SFIASASQPWITLSATPGEIGPGGYALTVGVNPATLQPGVLEGEVRIVGSGANTISIPVRFSLNVSTLTATPIQLTYNYQLGAAAPAEQTITLASSNATPVTYTAAAATQTGGAWLSVTPASGSTATAPTLRVIVNPLQLAAGTYRGTITVTPTGQAGTQPTVINVTLNVTAPSAPVISTVLNAATNTPTSISPGLIIAIKGVNLGPATPLEGQVQNGFFTTERSGVRVLFDGSPAPVYYVSATQINAIAPYTIANRTTTRVAVDYLGQRSEALEFRVVESSPGLFTLSGTGSGQAAIVNLNGTINGTANPAQPGSVVILYGTGEGQTRPAGETGRIISQAADVRTPIGAVSVMIGGRPAEVLYAGSAGGLVSGAFQLNVRVPTDLGITGQTALPVTVRVGNATSASEQTNALILVRP
ncbi:MAG TPA: IPT/TIG domain-containing protein, partial [Bryobacteraceae bacterium]|nr:IPT/TIG domain-containing protein [Bryobacteraceae bacterium]